MKFLFSFALEEHIKIVCFPVSWESIWLHPEAEEPHESCWECAATLNYSKKL